MDRVREFANERNLLWKIDDNSCIDCIGVDVIFTSKDYAHRKRYTICYDVSNDRNWRISIDARLSCIFANVANDFRLDLEPRSKITYNSYAELVNYDYSRYFRMPSIKNVIFNDPATIVFWNDGTKTIVKAQDGDTFDPEKGLAMAISKKALGNKGNYCETFKKWLPEEDANDNKLEEEYDNTEILTAKQLAEKIGSSVSTVLRDCRRGLHPGAIKVDNKWLIPFSG